MTGSLGTETVSGSAPVSATGNALTSNDGDPTITAGAIVSPTGLGMTFSLGDETQETSYEAPSVAYYI